MMNIKTQAQKDVDTWIEDKLRAEPGASENRVLADCLAIHRRISPELEVYIKLAVAEAVKKRDGSA